MNLFVNWCNMCQEREATVKVTMESLNGDDTISVNACINCARRAIGRS